MARICPISGNRTTCTDHCKDCARDAVYDLKIAHPNTELTEDEIIAEVGLKTYELIKQYNLTEELK